MVAPIANGPKTASLMAVACIRYEEYELGHPELCVPGCPSPLKKKKMLFLCETKVRQKRPLDSFHLVL